MKETIDPAKPMYQFQREAFELWMKIENRQYEAYDKIIKLERQQLVLEEKKSKQQELAASIEEQAGNTKILFKTIMCPLRKTCPKDNSQRFPKSTELTTN